MIKLFWSLAIMMLFPIIGFSQYTLKTPDGKTVKLYENGKWEYVLESKAPNKTPAASTSKYFSKSKKYFIKYDPKQWLLDTTQISSTELEWNATFRSNDFAVVGYCSEYRLAVADDYAETYIKSMWEDLGTIKSFRKLKDSVNKVPVTSFELEMETSGIVYTYKGYLTSTLKGSFLFVVGTQKEVFEEDKLKIIDLLNGLAQNN
jgi:hypothetical protein